MKVKNRNGAEFDCSDIYDAWYLAMFLKEYEGPASPVIREWGDEVLKLWHQAHTMKDALEGLGEAGLVDEQEQ